MKHGIKDDKLMIWPPCSLDLNPIENLWSIIKQEVYVAGKQYNSKDELWNAVKDTANNVSKDIIRNLTCSVDNRLLSLVQKEGGYINHWDLSRGAEGRTYYLRLLALIC